MNTTEQPKITSAQVIAWLLEKRDECMAITPNSATAFSALVSNFRGSRPLVEFDCYNEFIGHSEKSEDPDAAIENFRYAASEFTNPRLAQKKRQQAAKLLAEAEKLESEIN